MTQFDYIALALLVVSGLTGFVRGATREMVTVMAFLIAAAIALFALRFTGPPAREAIDPDWAGNVVAIGLVFVVANLLIRLAGGGLVKRVQDAEYLGTLDRTVGGGFGVLRALVILGTFSLVFHAATPVDRVPQWISGAALYPLTRASGEVLKAFVPKGLDMAGRLKPALEDAVRDGGAGAADAADEAKKAPVETQQ